jgi:hypothetical protein
LYISDTFKEIEKPDIDSQKVNIEDVNLWEEETMGKSICE